MGCSGEGGGGGRGAGYGNMGKLTLDIKIIFRISRDSGGKYVDVLM